MRTLDRLALLLLTLVGAAACGSSEPGPDGPAIAFYRGPEVDYDTADTLSTGANLRAALVSLGTDVIPFTDATAGGVAAALAGKTWFVVPSLAVQPFADPTLEDVSAWIQGGGALVIAGGAAAPDLLNTLLASDITAQDALGSGSAGIVVDWEGAPDALPINELVRTLSQASLPAGAHPLYAVPAHGAAVVDIPLGAGHIYYLGWTWRATGPEGAAGSPWTSVLANMITGVPYGFVVISTGTNRPAAH